ncbi:hypothetical protein BESB_061330 [Besnoitia besnoiti]|uniref:S1 motif domain-containing protein n=1 Tax=Besnoitia besnoiti TaxID=94643 RepID=A0A2A9MH10_BESBE|nr:hypothetical protein BESB_061330 [Besnoitia besnoiti]PFH35246.1 hypothetical protein BESB_061330 [Besnoitia besnoiti]
MAQPHRAPSGPLSSFLGDGDFPRAAPRQHGAAKSNAQSSSRPPSSGGVGRGAQARAASQPRQSSLYSPLPSLSSRPFTPGSFTPASLANAANRKEKPSGFASAAAERPGGAEASSAYTSQSSEQLQRLVRPVEASEISRGTLLLGVVAEIHANELIVHLPYGIFGYVPRVQAQEEVAQPSQLARAAFADSDADEDEDDGVAACSGGDRPAQLPLTRCHYVGQIVQAVVLGGGRDGRGGQDASADDDGARMRKTTHKNSSVLLLSLRPSLFNAGLSLGTLTPSMVLPASVAAIEEHGYMLSFGVHQLSGFLPFSKEAAASPDARLPLDAVLSVRVDKVNSAAKVLICALPGEGGEKTDAEDRAETIGKKATSAAAKQGAPLPLKASLQWPDIKPGLLVQAKVVQVLRTADLAAAEAEWREKGRQAQEKGGNSKRKRRDDGRERRQEEEIRGVSVTCLNGLPGVVLQSHLVHPLQAAAAPSKSKSGQAALAADSADAADGLASAFLAYEESLEGVKGRVLVGRVIAALPDVRRVYICLLPHVVAWAPAPFSARGALPELRPGTFLYGASRLVQTPAGGPQGGDARALVAVSEAPRQRLAGAKQEKRRRQEARSSAAAGQAAASSFADGEARPPLVVVRVPTCFAANRAQGTGAKKQKEDAAATRPACGDALGEAAGDAEYRVLYLDRFGGEVVAGTSAALLDEKILTPFDVEPGDFVLGTVTKILLDRAGPRARTEGGARDGVVVSLSPHLSAFVPLYQLSDIPLSSIPSFVSVGATLKLRVLSRFCCASCSALEGPVNRNFFYFFPSSPLPLPGAAAAFHLAQRYGASLMASGGGGRVKLYLTAKKSFLKETELPLQFLTRELPLSQLGSPFRTEDGQALAAPPRAAAPCLAHAPGGGLTEGAVVTAYIREVRASKRAGKAAQGVKQENLPFVTLSFLGGSTAQLTKEQVSRAVQEGRSLAVGALMKVRIISINAKRRSFRVSLGLRDADASGEAQRRGGALVPETGLSVAEHCARILAVTEEGLFVALRLGARAPKSADSEASDPQADKRAEKKIKKAEKGGDADRQAAPILAFVPKLHLSDEVRLAEELCSLLTAGETLPFGAVVLSRSAAVRPGAPVQLWKAKDEKSASEDDPRVKEMAKLLAHELKQKDGDEAQSSRVVRDVCLLSCKPSLRSSAADGTFLTGSSALAVLAGQNATRQRVMFGYVRRVGPFGLLLSFGAWQLTGLVPLSYISDSFVEGENHLKRLYREGMTVRGCVVSVDERSDESGGKWALAAGEAEDGAQRGKKVKKEAAGAAGAESRDAKQRGDGEEVGRRAGKPLQFVVDIRPRRLSVLHRQQEEAQAGGATKGSGGMLGIDVLKALLDQREFAARLGREKKARQLGDAEEAREESVRGDAAREQDAFYVGQLVQGRVTQVLPNCVLVALQRPGDKRKQAAAEGSDEDETAAATGVVLEHQLPEGDTIESLQAQQTAQLAKASQGMKIACVVLDVDPVTGIIDLSCRRRLVAPLEKVKQALAAGAAEGRTYVHFALHGPVASAKATGSAGDAGAGAKSEGKKKKGSKKSSAVDVESQQTLELLTERLLPETESKKSGKKSKQTRGGGSGSGSAAAWDSQRHVLPPSVLARAQELCAATPPSCAEVQVENAAYAVLAADFSLSVTFSDSSEASAASAAPALTVSVPLFLVTLSCRNNTLQPCQLAAAAFDSASRSSFAALAGHSSAASVSVSPFLVRHAGSGVLVADCCWERRQQALVEAQQRRGARLTDRALRDQLHRALRGGDAAAGTLGGPLEPSSVENVEEEVTVGKLLRCRVTFVGPTVALGCLKKPRKTLLIRLHAANALPCDPANLSKICGCDSVAESEKGAVTSSWLPPAREVKSGAAAGAGAGALADCCKTPLKSLHPGAIIDVRVLRLLRDASAPHAEEAAAASKKAEEARTAAQETGGQAESAPEARKNEWIAEVALVSHPQWSRLLAPGAEADDLAPRDRDGEGKRKRREQVEGSEEDAPQWAVVEKVGSRGLRVHCGISEAAEDAAAGLSKKRKLGVSAALFTGTAGVGATAGAEERGRIDWGDAVRGAAQEAPEKQFSVGDVLCVRRLPVLTCTSEVFEEALQKFSFSRKQKNDATDDEDADQQGAHEHAFVRNYTVVALPADAARKSAQEIRRTLTEVRPEDNLNKAALFCADWGGSGAPFRACGLRRLVVFSSALCSLIAPLARRTVYTSLPAALSAWSAWRFPPGTVCWGFVHHFLSAPFAVAVQISGLSLSAASSRGKARSSSADDLDAEEEVIRSIVNPPQRPVRVPVLAAVHTVEVLDDWVSDPVKRLQLKIGQAVKLKILPIKETAQGQREMKQRKTESRSGLPLEASLRLSRVEAPEGSKKAATGATDDLRSDDVRFEDLEVGQRVSGLVVSSGQAGVFVAVSRTLTLRIKLQKLLSGEESPRASDKGGEASGAGESAAGVAPGLLTGDQAKELFPVGRLLQNVRIVALDPETRRIEGSLKNSSLRKRQGGKEDGAGASVEEGKKARKGEADQSAAIEGDKATAKSNRLLEKLKVGDVLDGRVRGLEAFGAFVRLQEGEDGEPGGLFMDVLCHVSDMGGKDWNEKRARLQRLQKGDLVRARITKIDRKQGKAWISLDPEVFDDESDEEEEDDALAAALATDKEDGDDLSKLLRLAHAKEGAAESDSEEEDVDMDSDSESKQKPGRRSVEEVSTGMETGGEADLDDDAEEVTGSWSASISAAGDAWAWGETKPARREKEASGANVRMANEEGAERDASDLSAAEDRDEKSTKAAARRRREEEARRQEENLRVLEDSAGQRSWMENPRSPEDFERLVLVNGNSAAVWISYVAYYLKLNELQMARQVAERAVQHINHREEQERSSVWIAYLNLECVYGDRVDDVFKRAIQYNDSKKIHYQMTFIYEKAHQLDKARQMCEKCCEKFPASQKIWVRHLTLLYTALDAANTARELMLQALFRLPRRKHVEFVATCARLEYKHGSKERGQTYFEKLLAEHPRRTDIWSQYLDAHIAANTPPRCVPANLQSIRVLFERTTSLQLKLRKMKFFFTRWLIFEKQHGTVETQARVRSKARDFVQSVESKMQRES